MNSSHYSKTFSIIDPIEDTLVRKVNEMGHQLEALKIKSEHPYEEGFNTASAFTSKIMEEPILAQFRMLQTKIYDSSIEPLDHLEAFKTLMLLHGPMMGLSARLSWPC